MSNIHIIYHISNIIYTCMYINIYYTLFPASIHVRYVKFHWKHDVFLRSFTDAISLVDKSASRGWSIFFPQ